MAITLLVLGFSLCFVSGVIVGIKVMMGIVEQEFGK